MAHIDSRQLMIIFQNSMAHATKLAIHNSKGEKVELDEVLKLAKLVAQEVITIGIKSGE